MSSIVFAAVGLTVVALCAVLLLRGVDGSRRSRTMVTLLVIAPAVLVCGVMLASITSLGSVRIALEGAQFRMLPNDEVTVGGAGDDDIVVGGLPAHFLEFRPADGGVDVLLQSSVVSDQDGNGYAVVRVDDKKPFANSVALDQSPTEIAEKKFALDKPGFVDEAGVTYPTIPSRVLEAGQIRIPILRALPPEVQIHPLRFLAAPKSGNDVARSAAGRPYGSFICREGGFFRRTSYAVLAGDGVPVRLPGGRMVAYDPKVARIDSGQSRRFALHRVDFSDPRLPNAARSRVQERRSFSATFDGTMLKLVFDTPEYVSVPRVELERLTAMNSRDKPRPTFALTIPGLETTIPQNEMLLTFASVGSRLAYELFGRIRLEGDARCPLRVTTHQGTRCFAFGDGFAVGEDAAALFRISRFGAPFGSMFLILAVCLATLFFATSALDTPMNIVTYAVIEFLLGLRILIGYAGSLGDPGAAPAYWQSILALVLAPFVIRIGVRLARGERHWTLIAHACVVAIATAIVFNHIDGRNFDLVLIIVVSLAAVAGAAFLWRLLDMFVSDASVAGVGRLIVFAVALIFVRSVTFGVLGWKERMTLPFAAVAVSLYYVPATIILFAMIWGVVRQRTLVAASAAPMPRRPVAEFLAVVALLYLPLAVFHIGLPKAVSDLGSMFVFAPPLLIFFALPLLERRSATTWALALPCLFVLLLVAAPLASTMGLFSHDQSGQPSGTRRVPAKITPAQAEKIIETRLGDSDNWLRVLSIIDPDRVAAGGTNAAERMVVLERTLRRYNSRGALGAGYLDVPVTQTVEETQLNDNLSSVHVMATFGWLGTGAVLLLVILLAIAPLFDLHGSGKAPLEAIDAPAAVGILSLWTIAGAALYMFAANLGLVFFTGKNVYFLAAASESDVFEGVILVVLALVALAHSASSTNVANANPNAAAGLTP